MNDGEEKDKILRLGFKKGHTSSVGAGIAMKVIR